MNKNKLIIKVLFHYDKDKWKKINKQKNFNENEAKINEFNEKNRKKLFNLKIVQINLNLKKLKLKVMHNRLFLILMIFFKIILLP